ncbi:UvrD-helicase domain-containing protein [Shouchella shacheensis]|uniref:UvrD-helicase domain-containing protein n=1 Tax=Shouchella shacheensis TaxID=1649580 RepID=UPI00073FF5F3|nr:UvrD-helicase domain-containing protein [Shouchella shacheensis]
MKFNDAQLEAITASEPLVVVSAGAGSGKTRVLTERIVSLCETRLMEPDSPQGATISEIAAITFTEKAAREMKSRLRERLAAKVEASKTDAERSYWLTQKEEAEEAMIATFHRFSLYLLRRFARFGYEEPGGRLLDETQARLIKLELLEKTLKNVACREEVRLLLQHFSKSSLVAELESMHNAIVEIVPGEEVLGHLTVAEMWKAQVEALDEEKKQIVAAFTKDLGRAVLELPAEDELTPAQAKHVGNIGTLAKELQTVKGEEERVKQIKFRMPKRGQKAWQEKIPALYTLYEESWKPLKKHWEAFPQRDDFEEARPLLEAFLTLLQSFANDYRVAKEKKNALDFSDLQQKTYTLLACNEVQEACRKQYRHIMVDEFQDTNPVQLAIVEAISPPHLFFVGDEKQSIYRFRGADVALMAKVAARAEQSTEGRLISLHENYRTAPQIVTAVNELFAHMMSGGEEASFATRYSPLSAGRASHASEPALTRILAVEEEEEEFSSFAKELKTICTKGNVLVASSTGNKLPRWGDVAILMPARTKLLALEEALSKEEIPYVVYGGVGFFERQEIRDMRTILNWINRPFEDSYVLALLRSPLFGLSMSDFLSIHAQLKPEESFADYVSEPARFQGEITEPQMLEALQLYNEWMKKYLPFRVQKSVEGTLNELFLETGLRQVLLLQENGLQRIRNVEKLIAMLVAMDTRSLELMMAQLESTITASRYTGEAETEKVDGNAVHIMTIHASKGLEFPVICLPQLERRMKSETGAVRFDEQLGLVMKASDGESEWQTPGFTVAKARADERAQEELKRLYYVAMTRAEDYCLLAAGGKAVAGSWLALTERALEDSNPQAIVQSGARESQI